MALTDDSSAQEPPPFSAATRLLVVAPHPDDETLATGLLIQQVLAAGGQVRVLLLTSGDNNPWPQRWIERRWRIGANERKRWGRRRYAEVLAALDALGLGDDALRALGWPDMGLTACLLQPSGSAVDMIASELEAFAPSLVAMPSLQDRHPDHGAAHVLVRLALLKCSCRPQLLTYLVHGRTQSVTFVTLTGVGRQQVSKLRALVQHHSQMVLSGRRMRRLAERPERYVPVVTSPTISPRTLPWRPAAWMRPCLRFSLVSSAGTQSWRWSEAPLERGGDGSFRLLAGAAPAEGPCFVKLAWDLHTFWIFDLWGWCEL